MASTPPASIHPRPSLAQRCARAVLKALGWRTILVPPPGPKGIIIVYPHTSNWDFIVGMLYRIGSGLPLRWMGKDTLFRWPLRRLLLRLGGIPINRREQTGFVAALLAEFGRNEWLWLAMAPEGTRARADHWKSGFYRIAIEGRLPVGLGYIDYATRMLGVDTYLSLGGDAPQDMARIGAFYAGKRGLRPGNESAIRLRQ